MNYKTVILLPVFLLILSLLYLFYVTSTTGLKLGIDLKGGTQITANSPVQPDEASVKNALIQYSPNVRVTRSLRGYGIVIEVDSSIKSEDVIKVLQDKGYNFTDYSTQSVTPSLGTSFFQQAQIVLAFAFLFMAITVFIIFKIGMPSIYVVISAFADIVEALAFSQLLGIELSLATFAALLLLIGYSVDTDILLTTRVIKSPEGDLKTKINGAMKTGLTMIGATAAALLALFLIVGSSVITEIASVLVIGLFFDAINTWLTNANLLRWYIERKSGKHD